MAEPSRSDQDRCHDSYSAGIEPILSSSGAERESEVQYTVVVAMETGIVAKHGTEYALAVSEAGIMIQHFDLTG